MARLTTPLVWPRRVKTSSPCDDVPELDRPVVAGGGEPPAAGKIGDGGDQAGVPDQVAVSWPVDESQSLTSAASGPRYVPPTEAIVRPSGENARSRTPCGVSREAGELRAGCHVPDLGRPVLAAGGDPAAVGCERDGCSRLLRALGWSGRSSRRRRPRAGWFRLRTPWPRAVPSRREIGVVDRRGMPSSARRGAQVAVSQRLTDVPSAAGGQGRSVGGKGQGDVAQHARAGRSGGAAPRRCEGPRSGRCRYGPRRRGGRRAPGPRCRPSRRCCGTSPGCRGRRRPELDGAVLASRCGQSAVGPKATQWTKPVCP